MTLLGLVLISTIAVPKLALAHPTLPSWLARCKQLMATTVAALRKQDPVFEHLRLHDTIDDEVDNTPGPDECDPSPKVPCVQRGFIVGDVLQREGFNIRLEMGALSYYYSARAINLVDPGNTRAVEPWHPGADEFRNSIVRRDQRRLVALQAQDERDPTRSALFVSALKATFDQCVDEPVAKPK